MDIIGKNRLAAFAIVTGLLLVIPALVLVLVLRVESIFDEAVIQAVVSETGRTSEEAIAAGISAKSLCASAGADFPEACGRINMVERTKLIAYLCLFAGLLLVAMPWLGRVFAGGSRARLAMAFAPLARIVTVGVGVLVTIESLIGSYAFYVWEVEESGRFHIKLLLLPLAGGLVGLGLIVAGLAKFRQDRSLLFGSLLNAQGSPKLFGEITEVARALGSAPPDNVVAGLEPTFFVTSAPARLLDGTLLNGRTLFLSLPMLRIFDKQELRAVVGHELSHFKGEDTEYSLKFSPVYARLSETLQNTSGDNALQAIASAPIALMLREFAESERTIGRERELIADRGAASVAPASSLVTALIKIGTHSFLWPTLVNESETRLASGVVVSNLSEIYAGMAIDGVAAIDRDALREQLLSNRMSHPIDTHPTLAERASALGVDIDSELERALTAPTSSAAELIDGLEAVEEYATNIQHHVALLSGRVVMPKSEPAEST